MRSRSCIPQLEAVLAFWLPPTPPPGSDIADMPRARFFCGMTNGRAQYLANARLYGYLRAPRVIDLVPRPRHAAPEPVDDYGIAVDPATQRPPL